MNNAKGIAAASLVCSLVGLVLAFFLGGIALSLVELALCILGIILGAKGMKACAMAGQGKGLAVAGLVLGIIGVVFASANFICAVFCMAAVNEAENLLNEAADAYSDLDLYY